MKKLSRYAAVLPFVIILIVLLPLIFVPKDESFLIINGFHSPFRDWFFKNITWLGEGFLMCCCILLLPFLKIRWFIVFVIALGLHVLLIQVNKQFLFNEVYRPLGYFRNLGMQHVIHFVAGVKVHHAVSFPSGHTTGATFAISFIALVVNNKKFSWLLAFLAITVGISRVYLAQHFLVDIYFGFLFGMLSSVLALLFVQSRMTAYKWMEKYLVDKVTHSKRLRIRLEIIRHSFYMNLRSAFK